MANSEVQDARVNEAKNLGSWMNSHSDMIQLRVQRRELRPAFPAPTRHFDVGAGTGWKKDFGSCDGE